MTNKERTRFADYIQNYMWDQRPPMRTPQFAQLVDVPKQTIYSWIAGATPARDKLRHIGPRMGVSVATLFELCGYEYEDPINAVLIERDKQLPDTVKHALIRIRDAREEYDASASLRMRGRTFHDGHDNGHHPSTPPRRVG